MTTLSPWVQAARRVHHQGDVQGSGHRRRWRDLAHRVRGHHACRPRRQARGRFDGRHQGWHWRCHESGWRRRRRCGGTPPSPPGTARPPRAGARSSSAHAASRPSAQRSSSGSSPPHVGSAQRQWRQHSSHLAHSLVPSLTEQRTRAAGWRARSRAGSRRRAAPGSCQSHCPATA